MFTTCMHYQWSLSDIFLRGYTKCILMTAQNPCTFWFEISFDILFVTQQFMGFAFWKK